MKQSRVLQEVATELKATSSERKVVLARAKSTVRRVSELDKEVKVRGARWACVCVSVGRSITHSLTHTHTHLPPYRH